MGTFADWRARRQQQQAEYAKVYERAFLPGPAAIETQNFAGWMTTEKEFGPAQYGDYLRTSNIIYSCITLRADLLAEVDLKLYKGKRRKDRKEVETGSLRDLLDTVNPFWTWSRLIKMSEMTLGLWGENYWLLERGKSGTGEPREIWWAKPTQMTVVKDGTNYIRGFLYQPAGGGEPIAFAPSEVMWMPYPNPLDQWSGLAPLGAARLAADYESSAAQSNHNLFKNGMQFGGFISPKGDIVLTPEQTKEAEDLFRRKFSGAENANKWAVLRSELNISQQGVTPKDAEFIAGLNWSVDAVGRVYRIASELLNAQGKTFENFSNALRSVYILGIKPEAAFIASEITEKLLPMFKGQADVADFDFSDVEALQEDKTGVWDRATKALAAGAITKQQFADEVGIEYDPAVETLEPAPAAPVVAAYQTGAVRRRGFGDEAHQLAWRRFDTRTSKQESEFEDLVSHLLRTQRDQILDTLDEIIAPARGAQNGHRVRAIENLEPFDMDAWVDEFRKTAKPQMRTVMATAGEAALDEIGVTAAFDVDSPAAKAFLQARAQRFAEQVNQTTWDALRTSLAEGLDAGESILDLAVRVETIMAGRINSDAETIARTEVLGASNGGTLEGYRQSGVVDGKRWLAALDNRTRDDHAAAHGQTVGLNEDFEVGGSLGPAPGQMGSAEQDINCRCTITAVIKPRAIAPQTYLQFTPAT